MVDPEQHPELAGRLIEARNLLRERLAAAGMAELVEPFDPERYNDQATIGENLLFGVPTSRALIGRALAEHARFREALKAEGISDDLAAMGAQIAETMIEIFRGLPPGHPLFEQFSFIAADELPEYEAILRRRRAPQRRAASGATTGRGSWPCRSPISSRAIASAFSTTRSRLASSRRAAPCASCSSANPIPASSSTTPRRSAPPRRLRTTCCSAASATAPPTRRRGSRRRSPP